MDIALLKAYMVLASVFALAGATKLVTCRGC